jgi:transcriptional regulator of arginine metabolism
MTEKSDSLMRQEAIKKLLNKTLISDQKTLVNLLKSEFGIETNQSVLSRDLRKLGVIKKEFNQKLFYTLPNLDMRIELLKLAITDIKYNETMIVVKTHPGLAAFVGDYIDSEADLSILGCLAGENVVFIACDSIKNIQDMYEIICEKLHFKKKVKE